MHSFVRRAGLVAALWSAGSAAFAATQVIPLAAPIAAQEVAPDVAPGVATDGAGYLVVWERSVDGVSWVFYGRATASGALLDPDGLPLGPGRSPAVAWGGAEYLVAFAASDADVDPYAVRVARIAVDGAVVQGPTTVWSGTGARGWVQNPSVAFNGSEYLVAWFEYAPWYSIFGVRVSAAGVALDATPIPLAPQYTSEVDYVPSIASAGGDWLVAWTSWQYCYAPPGGGMRYAQYATRVNPDGVVLDPAGLAVARDDTCATSYWQGAAAFDGAAYLVAYGGWTDPPGGGGVMASRLSPAGSPVAPTPIALSGAQAWGELSAVHDGRNLLVAWAAAPAASTTPPGPITGARVAPDGTVIEQGIAIAARGSHVRTALEQGHGLAVWLDAAPDGAPVIRGARLASVASIAVSVAGPGAGSVTSSPPGIACDDACSAEFYAPSTVTLTARPDGVSDFAGWSGACTGSQPTCTVAADQARSVVAQFVPAAVTSRLRVVKLGWGLQAGGLITSSPAGILCGKTCKASFAVQRAVTLHAEPDPGSELVGWSEPTCGGARDCTLTLKQSSIVLAVFRTAGSRTAGASVR